MKNETQAGRLLCWSAGLGQGSGGAAQVIQVDVSNICLAQPEANVWVFASLLPETRERVFWFKVL